LSLERTKCKAARWYYDEVDFKAFNFNANFLFVSSYKNHTTGIEESICIEDTIKPTSSFCIVKD